MNARSHVDLMKQRGHAVYNQTKEFRVDVPPGKSGDWEIKPFTTELNLEYARLWRNGREPGLGMFTALRHKGHVIMSDTAAEIADLRRWLYRLQGRVLVTGLGLGMVVRALTNIERYLGQIHSITVIEKSPDVFKLVAPHYKHSRVEIINDDAYTWKPKKGSHFDSAWHDIWPTICGDNLEEMKRLRIHYRSYITAGQQFCWAEAECEELRD